MFSSLLKFLAKRPIVITVLFFSVLATLSVSIVFVFFESLSKNYINEKFVQTERFWESLMISQRGTIEIYFNFLINTKKTKELMKKALSSNEEEKKLVRTELFTHIFPLYNNLRKHGNIRQVHFFTPDNRSFLRMHAPHEYGDDLSKARPTVVYVNIHRKPVLGFDPGYYLSGFRYVFPLFDDEGNHLGGVEISKPFHALRADLIEVNSEFEYKLLIKQEVVLSRVAPHRLSIYQPSPFGNVWLEEDPLGELADSPPLSNPTLQAVYYELPKNSKVWEKLSSPKGGVTTIDYRDKDYIVAVIKIYDIDGKEVAALLGVGHSKFLKDIEEIKVIMTNVALLLSILASVLLYLALYSSKRTFIEREKVKKLIENSQRAGVILDRNGRIIYANRRFQTLFGYREVEILRHDFHDLLYGHAVAREDCPVYNATINGKELTAVEKVYASNGEEFNAEITILPLFVEGKNFGSMVLLRKL